ncbi:MAG: SDR family NAD(P)-dependent oxidoreductase [Deltaproteobacteria bacterium]|nr:SDR family NAD(P)-dependent oxidoreductase [Deltaproteobacteria bacterium]
MKNLKDKIALVTGAGNGIGRCLALQLAEAGCRLALVDVRQESLDGVAKEVEAHSPKVTTHIADVSDEARMQTLAEEVVHAHGGVDIVINNAGVTSWGTFEEISLEDARWVMDVSVWGTIHGCKFFLPHLRKAEVAHIVNISSVYGFIGIPRQAVYCASKYAVRGFTESLRTELEDSHIGVTVVHPGGVATRFVTDSRATDDTRKKEFADLMAQYSLPPEKVAAKIIRGIEKNKPRVFAGPEPYIIDFLRRIAPNTSQRVIGRWLGNLMP